jgi:hypothetical protein
MKTLVIVILMIVSFGHFNILLAKENNDVPEIISVKTKSELVGIKQISILLNGNDPLLTRIVEDAISIYLNKSGFNVTSRELFEKTFGENMSKMKMEKGGGSVTALDVGKAVNSDSILTGTVIIEADEDKSILIKIASFQLVDVITGKNQLSLLFEFDPTKGESFSKIAQKLVEIIKTSIK